jgi:hypothetical protein
MKKMSFIETSFYKSVRIKNSFCPDNFIKIYVSIIFFVLMTIQIQMSKVVYLSNKFNVSLFTSTSDYNDKLKRIKFNNCGESIKNELFDLWGHPRVNNNEYVELSIKKNLSQIGTDRYIFRSIFKEGRILEIGKDVYVNYTISSDTIRPSFTISGNRNKPLNTSANWKVECRYLSYPLKFMVKTYKDIKSYEKVVSWFGLNFVLFKHSLKNVFVMKLSSIENNLVISIDDYFALKTQGYNSPVEDIENILINTHIDTSYLSVIYQSTIVVFKLKFHKNEMDAAVDAIYEITRSFSIKDVQITGIGFLDEVTIVISTLKNGITVLRTAPWNDELNPLRNLEDMNLKREQESKRDFAIRKRMYLQEESHMDSETGEIRPSLSLDAPEQNNSDLRIFNKKYDLLCRAVANTFSVRDLIILNEMIYIIDESFNSLRVLTKIINPIKNYCFDNKNDYFLKFTNLFKLDHYFNYLTNISYIGVQRSSNDIKDPEVLFELSLQESETNPMINKIFASPNLVFLDTMATNYHFSFFLDKTTASMFVVRRGMTSGVKEVSYIIPVSKSFNINQSGFYPMFSIFDYSILKMGVGFFSEQGLVHMFNFITEDDEMFCKFNEPGDYKIAFEIEAESCQKYVANRSRHPKSFCTILIMNSLISVSKQIPYKNILNIIFGIVFSTLSLVLVILIFTCMPCCKRNGISSCDNLTFTNGELEILENIKVKTAKISGAVS